MRTSLTATLLAGGVMMLGTALAQTASTPSSTPAKPPAKPKTASTAHKSTTATKKPATAAKASPMTLTTEKEKFSYAVGMSIGNSLKQQNAEVDPAVVSQGLKDMLAGGKTLLSPEQAQDVLKQVSMALHAKHEQAMQASADSNKKLGDEFLKNNATQKDVVVLPSGLQYKILKQGTGPKPTANDTVECNYRGTLIDGKEFDASEKHGGPATFPVSGVIKGWTEALQLMPVGSKWQLFVPPDLAYGDRGAGPDIGPNATLIFEVELLGIKDKK